MRYCPVKLNRTLINIRGYVFVLQLDLCGGTEIKNVTVGVNGMLRLKCAVNSTEEYVLFEEQFSKAYRGGLLRDSHLVPRELKIFENEDKEKCPVRFLRSSCHCTQKTVNVMCS